MDGQTLAQPADPGRFDVDDPAGLHFERVTRMPGGDHALVQADRRLELCLELAMVPDIVLEQRLFDQEKVEIVNGLQHMGRLQGGGRVRIDL